LTRLPDAPPLVGAGLGNLFDAERHESSFCRVSQGSRPSRIRRPAARPAALVALSPQLRGSTRGTMCGRYSLAPAEFSQLKLLFHVEARLELSPRYNIAPTWTPGYEPPVVFETAQSGRQVALARWWMIPSNWSRPLKALPASFNARSEEMERKP